MFYYCFEIFKTMNTFQVKKRYKTERDGFTYRATILLGNKVYKGSGISSQIAQNVADYYAIQQSNYEFNSLPPGVARGMLVSNLVICI